MVLVFFFLSLVKTNFGVYFYLGNPGGVLIIYEHSGKMILHAHRYTTLLGD